VPVDREDELGKLAASFNEMAGSIETHKRKLADKARHLSRTNAELEQFAYVASHDLKAPLRAIDNLATWIAEDLEGNLSQETEENIVLLRQRVERMSTLLEGLLQYSRVGRRRYEAEMIDCREMIEDIVEDIALPPGFTVKLPVDCPTFESHRPPLEQVFRNLIGNAVKHHDCEGGCIAIRYVNGGEIAAFAVEDDGPGIDPNYHDKAFQMFQTLRPRDEVEGSGMDLALVKKIIEDRGGRIWLESTGTDRGATFHFEWVKSS